jgi:hypothetical protein
MSSPGQQPRQPGLSAKRVMLLTLPAVLVVLLWFRYPPLREYRLYLSETRPEVRLAWAEIRPSWTEDELAKRFPSVRKYCGPDYTGTPGAERICALDLQSVNGTPTMYANFMFSKNGLLKVATAIPWWSYAPAFQELKTTFGEPYASQVWWHSGVRLHGWQLDDGAAIFYNRDRSLNPMDPNSIQWLSASACGPRGCFH